MLYVRFEALNGGESHTCQSSSVKNRTNEDAVEVFGISDYIATYSRDPNPPPGHDTSKIALLHGGCRDSNSGAATVIIYAIVVHIH